MNGNEKKEFMKKEIKDWRLLHGTTKKMLWNGIWYKEVGNKLVKMK
jgi:hypothetical protein